MAAQIKVQSTNMASILRQGTVTAYLTDSVPQLRILHSAEALEGILGALKAAAASAKKVEEVVIYRGRS